MKRIALIPARSGSKRLPGKNIVEIGGHPLIAYSIVAALESGVFDQVIVSTDSKEIARIAEYYGANAKNLRPEEMSRDLSPDIDWVTLAINEWLELEDEDYFSILRPTNPLRSAKTLKSAMEKITNDTTAQSLRAIRKVREHPRKMWIKRSEDDYIEAYLPSINEVTGVESHSSPMQALESLFVQDASLEICQVWVARRLCSLTGTRILGFEMPGYEGFDINYPEDLKQLNYLLSNQSASLSIPIGQYGFEGGSN